MERPSFAGIRKAQEKHHYKLKRRLFQRSGNSTDYGRHASLRHEVFTELAFHWVLHLVWRSAKTSGPRSRCELRLYKSSPQICVQTAPIMAQASQSNMELEELGSTDSRLQQPPLPNTRKQTYLVMLGCCVLQLPIWGTLSWPKGILRASIH